MKNLAKTIIGFLLVVMVCPTSTAQTYHIKSNYLQRSVRSEIDSAYYEDTILTVESEFYIIQKDSNVNLYLTKDNIIYQISIENATFYEGYIFMDYPREGIRFIFSPTKGTFVMFSRFDQETLDFEWYLELLDIKIEKIKLKQFNKMWDKQHPKERNKNIYYYQNTT